MPVFGGAGTAPFTNDLIEETRRHLFSGQEEEVNQLTGNMGASDTTFNVNFSLASMNQRGCIIAVDLEEIRLWSTDQASTVTSCQRAVNGTTAATHTAGATITVRPKFSNFRILRALNEELGDLSSPLNGMYQVKTVDVTYNPAVQGYDLTGATHILKILEARFQVPGPSRNWPEIREYSLQRNMPTGTWPSGFAFDVYQRGFAGLPIHVRYAAPYDQLINLNDSVTDTTGLQQTATDLPPIGAAIRLVAPREMKRMFSEAGVEPRRSDEVPPGSVIRSTLGLQQLRQNRIRAEAASLSQQFPILAVV